jgi:hypothetical protein
MGDLDYRPFQCLQAGDRLLPWLRDRRTRIVHAIKVP